MIVTQEQPQLLAFLKVLNLVDGMVEFVERYLHQLVTRIVLENLDHVSAGVAGRRESHPLQSLPPCAAASESAARSRGTRPVEQAEELMFTDGPTLNIEDADGDVVEVEGPVHRRALAGFLW